jgi:5-methylthioadenosine/S-adenosylhomocysteine deaminase
MGMRCVQVGAANNFGTTPKKVGEFYEKLNHKHHLTAYHLGFHAEYTCSEALLKEIVELSRHFQAPVFTHLAETAAEVEGCKERHNGMTPAVYLDSLGMYDNGGGGYHCVHMSAEDFAVFQKRGLYAVTNPASNLKLASGVAPIAAYLDKNIPVAIGTDGPASNNCLDMFREMFLVTGLAKVRENDAATVPAMEVLKMACVNGAKCMGLKKATSLSAGSCADLIMIDLKQPNMQPLNNIANNIVYSGSKQNVALTMIHGNILYEKGSFAAGYDVEGIYRKANEIIERVR